jgi:ABC-type phosphate transport system substrate-binding protein
LKIFILLLLLFYTKADPAPESIVIIVNSQNSVTKLSLIEVRMYWMRMAKKRWPDTNLLIKSVDRKEECEEKKQFYSKVLKLSEDMVESYFVARQYNSGEKPPDKLGSDSEIIDFVGKEAGGIGYVKATSINPKALEKIKVIFTLE